MNFFIFTPENEENILVYLKRAFNSRRLRTLLLALALAILIFGYIFYVSEPKVKNYGEGIWWALVTITTVGYGDITPITSLGKFIAGALMFIGLGLIASVTAIISAKFVQSFVDHHTNDDLLEKLDEIQNDIDEIKKKIQ